MDHLTAARRTDVCRVVVLVSGGGSNLAALLAAHADPAYGARIVGVVSDRADAGALGLARDAHVPTAVVAPADFETRTAWDAGLASAVGVFAPALVVSAGFMRILGEGFLARFGGRTVNTHPALLPAFPGAHAVRDALAYGVRVTGCTLHVVDAGVDTGPVIAQRAVEVLGEDDEAALHERIKVAERELLVEWVGRVARGGMQVDGRHVRVPAPGNDYCAD
ncbi:MAG: phosphoribosylglycinamide formyltransferase [Cellulomonadaceae bacterium]